jgi:transposase-like protein
MARTRYTDEEREGILAEFAASGLSAAAYCRRRGIQYGTFLRWRGLRERDGGGAREPEFVEFAVETAGIRGPRGERQPVAELILGEGALLLRVYQVPARS